MKLIDIIIYIIKHCKTELTQGRLCKLVYLSDWKSCIEYGKQITDIQWYFNHYGPYVEDINNSINSDEHKRLTIQERTTYYGNPKKVIKLAGDVKFENPTEQDVKILDFVIKYTEKMNWSEFISLIYSTYPVVKSARGEKLDLVTLAKEYKK